MPECAVCSFPASNKCARCKCVYSPHSDTTEMPNRTFSSLQTTLLFLLLICHLLTPVLSLPSGLLVSFKPTPALSVPLAPTFSWQVPPSPHTPDATQVAYRVLIWPALGGALTWDSGRVSSNTSVSVPYGGAPLMSGRPYLFNVTTYLSEGTVSTTDPPAAFTTALIDPSDWAVNASFVWSSNTSGVYALIRKEVALPPIETGGYGSSPVALALLHASARTGDDSILCGYKVYLDGQIVGVGPGRGEARVWGGVDNTFRGLPYATYNVTALIPPPGKVFTLAASGVGAWFSPGLRGILLQLDLHHMDGSVTSIATTNTTTSGEEGFTALDADPYYNPTQPVDKSLTFYRPVHEFTDAREEPMGWQMFGFNPPVPWAPVTPTLEVTDPEAVLGLTPKMADSVAITPASSQGGLSAPLRLINATTALGDFGTEFQGGLYLEVAPEGAFPFEGVRLTLVAGESLATSNGTTTTASVGSTWGYTFTWTLRGGVEKSQVIEQMQYMEFRFVSITVEGAGGEAPAAPTPAAAAAILGALTLRAWRVAQAWDDSLSAFSSPHATLNAVWGQSRYTQEAGLLDTYTDSNTRERRAYECDGLIAASGRLLVQGDVAWVRHSHTYVFQHPTWPVEWAQMAPLLAWQDYWATGSCDLGAAYLTQLVGDTHYGADRDATGLLNTSYGRHIIDWDPWPTHSQYHQSHHFSVTQFFALAGLKALARLAGCAGNASMAGELSGKAGDLQSAILSHMLLVVNASGGSGGGDGGSSSTTPPPPLFCDGICADPQVGGFTSAISSAWALFCGVAQAAGGDAPAGAWARIASGGLEGYGSYGAFMYLSALASVGPGEGDDGGALLTALTKNDNFSWYGEMERMNATMTRESWTDPTATYSHPWSTSPILGVVNGLMGVQQTGPAWETFTVAPRLGGLPNASLLIPTIRGPLAVQANGTHTLLTPPCGSLALLCLAPVPRPQQGLQAVRLFLDGEEVTQQALLFPPSHACVKDVGCGVGGAPRTLEGIW